MNKNRKFNILKYSISLAILTTSGYSLGMGLCTSGVSTQVATSGSPYAQNCPQGKGAVELSGDAQKYIDKFGNDIKGAGEEIANQIAANTANEIKIITEGNKNIIETLVTVTNSQIKDTLKQDKVLLDMEMDYMTELKERELKANKSVIGLDDSKEEVLFILDELKKTGNGSAGSYNHAQEVIAAMKAKYDDNPDFMMPIRIKAASSKSMKGDGCPEYDPTLHKEGKLDGTCFYGVKANPGAKLAKYFEECSRAKRTALASVQTNIAEKASRSSQARGQQSYISKSRNQSAATISSEKIKDQIDTSCTVKEFGYKLCGKKDDGSMMSSQEYLTKVTENEIVPFANISSTNYLAPTSIGTIDGKPIQASDEELKAVRAKAVDATSDVAVSENTPPIVKTYRTSSQYYGAKDFVDNIVNREAISNANITKMKDLDSSLFQSKFMSRASALSLAENALMNPIEVRTGTKMATAIADGSLKRDGVNGEILKEDINGAGELDRLFFSIDKDYNRIANDATSAINSNGTIGIETAPTGSLEEMQIEGLVKSNKLSLKEYEQNEMTILLLATIVAQNANSEENINYINSLK